MFPGLVVDEQYILYTTHQNNPGILCLKEYFAEPMQDLWAVEPATLHSICENNPDLSYQLKNFAATCMENIDELTEVGFDIVGNCNVALIGNPGKERLVLLDPHNVHDPERFESCTRAGIEYLYEVVADLQ